MRKLIATEGGHGRSVRVFTEDAGTKSFVRVQWREAGRRRQESWPNTANNRALAKSYAKGVAERLDERRVEPSARLRVSDVFDRWSLANDHWRPRTRALNTDRWKKFQAFAGSALYADRVTPELVDSFRAAMKAQGHAVNQIAEHVKVVKAAYRFARERKLLSENPLAEYRMKIPKDERAKRLPEYTPRECAAILAQLSPKDAKQWRPWAAVVLDAVLGRRQKALLHLRWSDVDLAKRVIVWPAETDKMGEEWTTKLPRDAVRALRVAAVWRARAGYEGPWVFFRPGKGLRDLSNGYARSARQAKRDAAKPDTPWSYSSLNDALHRAADAAGVPRVKGRAMHGFRRMAATTAAELSGNPVEGLAWIGDTDIRMAARYLKPREAAQSALAARVAVPTLNEEGE